MFYPTISKILCFALKFFILISFSNALFLQLERIRNSMRLCRQIRISIKNVGINANVTQKKSMQTYQYLITIRKPTIPALNCSTNHPKSLRNRKVITVSLTPRIHGANLHHRHSKI